MSIVAHILIVVTFGFGGGKSNYGSNLKHWPIVEMQEFSSKKACEDARAGIERLNTLRNTVVNSECVVK